MPNPLSWLDQIAESAHVDALARRLARLRPGDTIPPLVGEGSRGSSTNLLAGALALKLGQPVLYVVAHLDEADDALEDLELFTQAGRPLTTQRFGALEVLPGESAVSLELLAERLSVVDSIASHRPANTPSASVLVAPIQALMQAVPRAESVAKLSLTLSVGAEYAPNHLILWLAESGYQRQDAIDEPGDFAVRGGIIDLYPAAGTLTDAHGRETPLAPIRIDFFGDQIDTLHAIDPNTLATGRAMSRVSVIGASADHIQSDDHDACLIDLLAPEYVVVMHEVVELTEQARGYYERLTNSTGIHPPNTVFKRLIARPHIEINEYSGRGDERSRIALPITQLPPIDTDAKTAILELGALASDRAKQVVVPCRHQAEADRLRELLEEHCHEVSTRIETPITPLHHGFVWEENPSLILIPHHELFHRYEVTRRVRKVIANPTGQASDAFLDLEVGDYVVHVDHGIARFVGLKAMKARKGDATHPDNPGSQEYLTLEFDHKALLHVPATQIDLIQKYIGGFQGKPPLSMLGGKRWARQKGQVAEAVKDMAAELLRVQVARETQPGISYPADTLWQREFEAEFPYDETEDQLSAIASIKRDMQGRTPMDRLICGDVGFGKTEVAIRAAFKAAEAGKQTAVLVPTTVLAEQHEKTFRGRFADYPFRIESLSRFKTDAEQRRVLQDAAEGKVDIIVGTHRLLSQDVVFKDLGLVIIDEEQRFGVEHKHKLLSFRLTADVLTLTATPIPRTLHMSMIGLRDISSLTTAPVDRRAVVTEVIPYNAKRIQQALIRELSRDGQCFFVHNRVYNIESVADDIQKLVPDARIVIGHGQMPPRQLEDVMLKFVRREADILVSTTIIESGIDIPTANTIFINQADHFGLADLHQLRGRVGRYKHRAYCYLLLPPDRTINEVSAKRLRAIEQYSMLGAGFKIAMRDLEIRGAGNLLGKEQSGHIAAVGYEMYCLLLEQETKRLKREPIIEPAKTHLDLPVAGSLPKRYIPSDKHRIETYRRLSRAADLAELAKVEAAMRDAFGDPPPDAQRLIDLTEIRIAASHLFIDLIKLEDHDLIFKLQERANLAHVFDDAPGRVSVIDTATLYYRPPGSYLKEPATLLAVLRKLLVRPLRNQQTPAEPGQKPPAPSSPPTTSPSPSRKAAPPNPRKSGRIRTDR